MENNKGLIHLYHGDGKGKTTCAIGLALRFSSYGKKVLIIQFLKNGSSGEIMQMRKFENVTVKAESITNSFSWNMNKNEKIETKKLHNEFLEYALNSDWELLVLDELCGAITSEMVSEELVKKILETKKDNEEIVITGRNPKDYIVDMADYITNMTMERHPFENGIPARKGIEF